MSSVAVALLGGPMYDSLYESIAPAVAAAGIRITHHFQGDHPALNTFLASGSAVSCDLVSTHTKYTPSQARLLSPLDGLYPASEIADFAPRTIELAQVKGQLLGIPRNADARLLHFRTDILSDAPQTWDDLLAVARRISRAPDFFGFVYPGRESGLFGTFYELAQSAGVELFPASGAPDLDIEGGRWALGFLRTMVEERLVPAHLPQMHYDEVHAFFAGGHAAMVGDWPGYYAMLRNPATSQIAERFAVVPYPKGPSGRSLSYGGSHTFALTRRGAGNPAAIKLLSLLTAREAQLTEARRGSVAVRRSVMSQIRDEATCSKDRARLDALSSVIENGLVIPPKLSCYPHIEEVIWRTVQSAIVGDLAVPAALRSISEQIRHILEDRHDD